VDDQTHRMPIAGAAATVMGLGRFGGGIGVIRYLLSRGARRVIVTDRAAEEALAGSLARVAEETGEPLSGGRIVLRLGGHLTDDFTAADLVVASPAVPHPWSDPWLSAARRAGVPVTTEIRLLLDHVARTQVIGVTGSAGKSTTSAMIAHLLRAAGRRAHLGGNIGGSLLPNAEEIGRDDPVVVELSSFMLFWLSEGAHWSGRPPWSPARAVITNITPNHLDWHGTFEHYQRCKESIARFAEPGDRLWRGDEDAAHGGVVSAPAAAPRDELLRTAAQHLVLPGMHNQRNAALALSVAADVLGASSTELAPLLANFRGLPHRLALIHETEENRFYDDSKSTTPEASVLAVRAFPEPARIHLIAGGFDKGSDLSPVAALSRDIAGLYAIGATGAALCRTATEPSRVMHCGTLDAAIDAALARLRRGDIVLLSPGCASWDQFTDYEARGRAFADAVRMKAPAPDRS